MDILTIKDLTFSYPTGGIALDGLSFSVREGEFVTLCGVSGCGKSTLLRMIKPGLAPHGRLNGRIEYFGNDVNELSEREAAKQIGFVMQDPEAQIVTDKVWHELAFACESVGMPQGEIRRSVAEMASYFGLERSFFSDTATLSGGEKQLMNLAGAAALHPKLLLLDEPTSQLDPIAAQSFIDAVRRLNRDLGITVLIAEHRLEELLPISDRVIVMEQGKIAADTAPDMICDTIAPQHPVFGALPVSARAFALAKADASCKTLGKTPLTVREGRSSAVCTEYLRSIAPSVLPPKKNTDVKPVLTAKNIWVSFGRELPDVLRSASISVHGGEIYAILGGNGSGKTTLLKVLAGITKPLSGKVTRPEKTAYLPQQPCALFTADTVREQLVGADEAFMCSFLPDDLWERNPYDLSGGEQQRLALAFLLAKKPDLLLMDEPTKGMDALAKRQLAQLLRVRSSQGTAVITVTHDAEFAAECADKCGLLFGGEIMSEASPEEFFSQEFFYTTPASRLSRGIADGIIRL